MDTSALALALFGACVTAGGFIWTLSSKLSVLEEKVTGHTLKHDSAKPSLDKIGVLETNVASALQQVTQLRADLEGKIHGLNGQMDAHVKEQGQAWQTINRTLGQIEGALKNGGSKP